MSPDAWMGIIAAVGSLLSGLIGGAFVNIIKAKGDNKVKEKEVDTKSDLDTNAQALAIYKDLAQTLTARVQKMDNDISTLHDHHAECQKKNAEQAGDIRVLQAKVELVTTAMQPLLSSVSEHQKAIMGKLDELHQKVVQQA